MMVVKIAGNTAAMLLAIGSPERASDTATPIAIPAVTPHRGAGGLRDVDEQDPVGTPQLGCPMVNWPMPSPTPE
jgi:hypothetical protein